MRVEQEMFFDYEGISGNVIIADNSDVCLEEQIEELIRQYYESKGLDFDELNYEGFDELKIKIEGES